MLFSEENYRFMYAALQEAEIAFDEKEIPVGAVIVKEGRIIGRGHNQTERLKDPTAHAEMITITAAANTLQEERLTGCDLYVTLEPCLMCTGAALLARVSNIYFASFDVKFGACGSIYNLPEDGKYNHSIKVYSGILEKESQTLLQNFFKEVRESKR
ncbi:MAG: nucleoside deaminase [Ignavibacteriaceae bacterium]|jgi:tRNA(adenine34) deaminase|nr:nucleoside deaminase [Ignavibacteriaceae bacterium]